MANQSAGRALPASPCTACRSYTRRACDNCGGQCGAWRRWFAARWRALQRQILGEGQTRRTQNGRRRQT